MRFAVYYAPDNADPLAMAGAAWLGRDPELNAPVRQPDVPHIAALTEKPRHYGFHATLRNPIRLRTGWDPFLAACREAAARVRPFALPPLAPRLIDGGFLALTLTAPCPPLQALCDAVVRATEPHRAAPTEAELARRRAASLTPRQERNLRDWGYPYVFEDFAFHMTLTRRLTPAEQHGAELAAAAHFAGALEVPRLVDEVCVFSETAAGFVIAERIKLGVLF